VNRHMYNLLDVAETTKNPSKRRSGSVIVINNIYINGKDLSEIDLKNLNNQYPKITFKSENNLVDNTKSIIKEQSNTKLFLTNNWKEYILTKDYSKDYLNQMIVKCGLFFTKENQGQSVNPENHGSDSFATKEIWYYEHRLPEGQKSYSKTRPIKLKEVDPIKKWWNIRKESEICWKVDIQTIIDRNYDLDIKNPNKQEEVHEYSSTELIQMLEKSFSKSQELLNQLKETVK